MTLALTLLLKSTVLFVLCGLFLLTLRRASASARHLVCLLTLGALLALPLFSVALPGWRLPVLQEPTPSQAPALPKREGEESRPSAAAAGSSAGETSPRIAAPSAAAAKNSSSSRFSTGYPEGGRTPAKQGGGFFILYLLGVLLAAVRPLLGLWGITHLRRICIPAADTQILSLADECAATLGLKRRPQTCRADVPVPMTWGGLRPVVLLPSASTEWPEDRLQAVLLHEMAHVVRRDWPGHRLADLACALYWFHPCVWLVARRLRAESEIACDDLVVSSGIPAAEYARHLLEIAQSLPGASRPPHSAIAMAQTPKIERRLTMILDKAQNRRTIARRALVFALVPAAAAFVTLAVLRPDAKAQATPQSGHPNKAMSKATARVSAVHAVPGEKNAYALFAEGEALTPEAATMLEKALTTKPDDYAVHLRLLGFYQSRGIRNDPRVALPAKEAYHQQAFWLIQRHPESVLFSSGEISILKREDPAAFEQGKALWLAQVAKQPGNATILGNAANYCLLSDDAAAEKLLRQAQTLQPKSPVWPSRLGQLFRLQGEGPYPSPAVVRQSAIKALAEYETAAKLADQMFRSAEPNTSADLAKTAFDAGEYDKARAYAKSLLEHGNRIAAAGKADPRQPAFIFHQDSDALHEAHLVLGRLALHDGNLAGAEAHLLAMGRVSGSSTLDSFGPNMQLAEDLLKAGRRNTVLLYFDECAKFWNDKQLDAWRSEVKAGKIPNFRGNLSY